MTVTFGWYRLTAPVSGKILDLDGRGSQRFRAKLIHVEGRAVDQDLIARIKEGPQKIGDHFIAAIADDEVLRLRTDVVRQRGCHRTSASGRPAGGRYQEP